jgi:hypothetical protein
MQNDALRHKALYFSIMSPLKSANSQGPVGRGPDAGGRQAQAPANTLAEIPVCIETGELAVICQVITASAVHCCLNSPLANAAILPCCTICKPIVISLPMVHPTVPVTITCLLLPGTNVAGELTEKLEMPANPGLGASIRPRPIADVAAKRINCSLIIIFKPLIICQSGEKIGSLASSAYPSASPLSRPRMFRRRNNLTFSHHK